MAVRANIPRGTGAERPQQRVVSAAASLFVEQGYAATSVRQIAQRAAVSLDTVYACGGKADIFLRALDVVLSGSADGTPLLRGPQLDAIWQAPTLVEVIDGLVAVTVGANDRATRIWPAFVEGAGSDATLATAMTAQNAAMRDEGRATVDFLLTRGLAHPGIDPGRVADLIWAEAHPARYQLLVALAGWSRERFTAQLSARIQALLTDPEAA